MTQSSCRSVFSLVSDVFTTLSLSFRILIFVFRCLRHALSRLHLRVAMTGHMTAACSQLLSQALRTIIDAWWQSEMDQQQKEKEENALYRYRVNCFLSSIVPWLVVYLHGWFFVRCIFFPLLGVIDWMCR